MIPQSPPPASPPDVRGRRRPPIFRLPNVTISTYSEGPSRPKCLIISTYYAKWQLREGWLVPFAADHPSSILTHAKNHLRCDQKQPPSKKNVIISTYSEGPSRPECLIISTYYTKLQLREGCS